MTTIAFNHIDLSNILTKFDLGVQNAHVYITNGNETRLKRDYGNGELNGVIVGNPQITSTHLVCSGGNSPKGVRTRAFDTDAMTLFTIYKRPANYTDFAMILTCYDSSPAQDYGISFRSSQNGIEWMTERSNGAGGWTAASANIDITDQTKWQFILGETSSETATKVTNLRTNETKASTNLNPRRSLGDDVFTIGFSEKTTNWGAEIHPAINVIINRLLSEEEKTYAIANLRKLAKLYGIIV